MSRVFSLTQRSALFALMTTIACGRTNPLKGAGPGVPINEVTPSAAIVVKLASGSPTQDPDVLLTVVDCTGTSAVYVNEGAQPTASDPAWQKCTIALGGITYTLSAGGGLHMLAVWAKDTQGNVAQAPVNVPVVLGSSMFAMGALHSCALIAGGVKCWGDNTEGQLGSGSTESNSTTPIDVSGLESGVDEIVAGPESSATCALKNGQIWCWGWNKYKELNPKEVTAQCSDGSSSEPCSSTPVLVVDASGMDVQNVVSLSGGDQMMCATFQDRSVRCWGDDVVGELGDNGASAPSTAVPVEPRGEAATWTSIALGAATGCAIVSGTGISCWGFDYANYVGDVGFGPGSAIIGGNGDSKSGNLYYSPVPRAVTALGTTVPDALAVGDYHACALTQGNVSCWGKDTFGQLGNGLETNSLTAVPVTLPGTPDLLVAGAHHACARVAGDQMACWGMNDYGQLGAVSAQSCSGTPCASLPVVVSRIAGVAGMAAGREQTCAATPLGVECWGSDASGLLNGQGMDTCNSSGTTQNTPCSHVPVVIPGLFGSSQSGGGSVIAR
jgi:alpha-tubulin suppressor-like RCC1 family protein